MLGPCARENNNDASFHVGIEHSNSIFLAIMGKVKKQQQKTGAGKNRLSL